MASTLSEITTVTLEETEVEGGITVLRPDPASPGVMGYVDYHLLTGLNPEARGPLSPSTPVGVRFYRSDSASKPGYTKGDPLVLFLPGLVIPTETRITWASHVTSSVIPALISALKQIPHIESVRLYGLKRDDVLVKELVRRGAIYEDRTVTQKIPNGVAWYGPKGSRVRMDGLEFWSWV